MDEVNLSYDTFVPAGEDNEPTLPPIIMLHGLMSTKETWESIPQELANKTGRKLYILDARNHGDSSWQEESTLLHMELDVIRFMKHHLIPTAVIVGHSLGGKTAMFLATKEPEKVEKLIIEDISNRPAKESSRENLVTYMKVLQNSLATIPLETDLESAKMMVAEHLNANIPPEQRDIPDYKQTASTLPLKKTARGFVWKLNFDALHAAFCCGAKQQNRAEGTYEGPTLVLYGGKSIFNVGNDKDLMLQMFPNSTFKEIKDAAHRIHAECPNEFLEAVVAFLK